MSKIYNLRMKQISIVEFPFSIKGDYLTTTSKALECKTLEEVLYFTEMVRHGNKSITILGLYYIDTWYDIKCNDMIGFQFEDFDLDWYGNRYKCLKKFLSKQENIDFIKPAINNSHFAIKVNFNDIKAYSELIKSYSI